MRSPLLASINLVAFMLGCSCLAHAIATAEWRRKGSAAIVLLIVLCSQAWLIPQAISFFGFHSTRFLYPLWFGNWIVLAFSVILFCLTVRGSSRDLSDAALLDGAGSLTTFRRVTWPTIRSAVIALPLLLVMATWTEFAGPFVGVELIGPLGMENIPALLVVSFLATLPVIAILFWARRTFLRGEVSSDRMRRS